MRNSRKRLLSGFAVAAATAVMTVSLAPTAAEAGRWDFSVHVPVHTCRPHYWYRGWNPPPPYLGGDYYPVYNPVVDRDVYQDGHYHGDGTVHTDTVVEDRHASYYSPGRNEAVTQPRTTVQRRGGRGFDQARERTSWIGADGQPHSTTITRTTTQDPWGNSHTDTQVSLKNRQGANTRNVKEPTVKVPNAPAQVKTKKKK